LYISKITNIKIYPNNIIELEIKNRLVTLFYQPGQYVYIKIPSISLFEYHPFSISSIKSKNTFTVHIKPVQYHLIDSILKNKLIEFILNETEKNFEYLKQIKEIFYKITNHRVYNILINENFMFRSWTNKLLKKINKTKSLLISVDGNYGRTSIQYYHYNTIFLIGGGIGVKL
jgi:predicted ferric reductase